ncbi:MAG: carbohydrate ABC transporter permease [Actinobacteria bacterium]|nr:carbohydrate ABC transporter permease [Actinomycetota bacterium]
MKKTSKAIKIIINLRNILINIPIQILCIFYSLVVLIPVSWAIVSSIRDSISFFKNPFGIPAIIQLSNFSEAWKNENVAIYFRNSLFMTAVSVFFIILLSALASYALTRLKFVGRINILILFVSGLFVPSALLLLPLFILLNQIHLLGSLLGLILVYIAYSFCFTIFVLVPFFNMIPRELEEAAFIDGATHFQVFWRIIIPLARPGLILATIFNIFGIWNELILAWTLISEDSRKTLPVGLANILVRQNYSANYGILFAAVTIAIAPIVILYIVFQRRLIGGLMAGALKE